MAIHGGASWLAAVCLLLLVELALQGAAVAPLVPAMFVFGDSTVDVGNNNFIDECDVGCKANYPHFGVDYLDHAPTGRFSNGYNLADQLGRYRYICASSIWRGNRCAQQGGKDCTCLTTLTDQFVADQ